MSLTTDAALAAAWTLLAPGRDTSQPYPRGFWPDVARVAIEMFVQQTLQPVLSFEPTRCGRGNWPEPTQRTGKQSAGKISASQKAANTAALLAALNAGASK